MADKSNPAKENLELGNLPMSLAGSNGGEHKPVGGLKAAPKIRIPKDRVGASELERARNALRGTRAQASSIKEWVLKTCLPQLDEIGQTAQEEGDDYLDMAITVIEVAEVDGKEEEVSVQKSVGEVRANFEASLESYLHWGENGTAKDDSTNPIVVKAIRKAAHTAQLEHRLSKVTDLKGLYGLLAEIFEEGYLEEQENGYIRGEKGKSYVLTDDQRFGVLGKDQAVVDEISLIISNLASRFRAEFSQQMRNEEAEIRKKGQIEPIDLWKGKAGTCALEFPSEGGRLKQGVVLVNIDENGRISVITGSEDFKELVSQVQTGKISISLNDLKDEDGSMAQEPRRNSPPKTRLSEKEYGLWLRRAELTQRFRYLVQRGLKFAIAKDEQDAKKERQKAKKAQRRNAVETALGIDQEGTLPAKEWIPNTDEQGKAGETVLVCENWEDGTNRFEFLGSRWAREIRDGKSYLRLVKANPGQEEFFNPCADKEFEESPRFEGVVEPGGKFLRAAWRQTKHPKTSRLP